MIVSLIVSWLIISLAVWVTAAVLPGFHLKDGRSALLVAAILGLLNFLLAKLLFFVFSILTLGLAWLFGLFTRWLINTLLLIVTDKLTDHLKIDGFGWALLGALLISTVSFITEKMVSVLF